MFLCCSVSPQVWRCFRRTCFCVAVFPLKCGVALDRHVSVLQCFLKCGVALGRHVSVLQCFLKCGVAVGDIDSWVENLRRVRSHLREVRII